MYGVSAIYGSIIVAGAFLLLFSGPFGKLIKLFPPVVTGTVVVIIGLSLIPTDIKNMGGGINSPDFASAENLMLSFGVLFFILFMNRFFKGFLRSLSVLLGIVIGTVVAAFMGKVDFTEVREASWLHMPTPFYFGTPTFEIVKEKDFVKGYRAEGIAFILGGIFNAFPYNTFAQSFIRVRRDRCT